MKLFAVMFVLLFATVSFSQEPAVPSNPPEDMTLVKPTTEKVEIDHNTQRKIKRNFKKNRHGRAHKRSHK